MTKAEIYALTTSLLDDEMIDTDLFETLLNLAKNNIENMRPWVYLREEDSSQTATSANTFTTPHNLPTNFRRWYLRFSIKLVDGSTNAVRGYRNIGRDQKFEKRNDTDKFYCDYGQGKLYLCGSLDKTYTIYQYYIKKSDNLIEDDDEWIFPSDYHAILAYYVAVFFKLGVDYDIISNTQGNNNANIAAGFLRQMEEWDGELQQQETEGEDYDDGSGWRPGTVPGYPRALI